VAIECFMHALAVRPLPRFLLHFALFFPHRPARVTLSKEEIRRHVQNALAEDLGSGDVTSLATIPESLQASASVVAREPLVVAGLALAQAAFAELDPALAITLVAADGSRAAAKEVLMRVQGAARAMLAAERVALNYLQRLSGVATLTARYVEAVRGTRAHILDTRKTTPGWRRLEKYAVNCGGGENHRAGLYDRILIKDNHLMALRQARPDPVTAAIGRARQAYPHLLVEVEADALEQVRLGLAAGADIILLDNMSLEQLRAAVAMSGGRARLEASGGVNLQIVQGIAQTGVDYISVGALTHAAPAVDIALDFEPPARTSKVGDQAAPPGRDHEH
jgi:nicotinate-nucleotide pyrophosphorylase (carboxylating)